jgi:hypothetical protein
MIFNVVFFALELTVLGDTSDPNNSILLILYILSIAGLISMRKLGAGFATFSLTYAFSFHAFNLIYYFASVYLINGIAAIINAIAIVYMFRSIFKNKFN